MEERKITQRKRSIGVTLFGIILIFISIMFLCVAQLTDLAIYSYGLTTEIDPISLLGWLIPALLGVGILRLSNFFRIVTLCVSTMLVFWTPIMYFYLRTLPIKTGSRPPLFSKYGIIDLFLILFGICAIYYFTRPKVKQRFMEQRPKPDE